MTQEKNTDILDILLINPPMYYGNKDNIWRTINSNFPPLGLASIAAYVREKGHSVKIIDSNIDSPSVDVFEDYLVKNFSQYKEIRYIGITATTGIIKKAYQITTICKKFFPKAIVIMGGVHPTFLTDEVLANKEVDLVAVGEGEITIEEIISGKAYQEIDGLAYRDINGNIIKNNPRKRILKLDELPMPAYDLLPMSEYRPAKGSYKRLPAMSMMTSRGCPGRCTFCEKTLGEIMVFRSAEKIFEEINYLIGNYGIKQILFYDDTFTVHRNNVIKLCDLIIENKTDITWTCFARVDYVDLELLTKMKKAGCHQVMYGVENVDQKILDNINKKINPDQVVKAVEYTKKAGIECRLAFMVGNPGDNLESVKKNIEFIKKVDPDVLIVNITTPFPGTKMYDWAKERGLLLTNDWDDYDLARPVMRLENMSVEEIRKCYDMMYRAFYFRPKFLIKRLFLIRSWDDVKVAFGGVRALLSFFSK